MTKGIVFDIQKFALHDGPGIRTVLFLKGCTLHCAWCSNPESQQLQPQLAYLQNKCIGCGSCVESCNVMALTKADKKISIDFKKCITCRQCATVCPTGALKVFGYTATAAELIDEVAKDLDYFNNSGGGLTLSGGEALVQIDFATELLRLAKERGINTAIETAGNISRSSFEKVFPYVDMYLFDYKLTNSELHKNYIGASNELLLSNIDYLYHRGAAITLRCPIIPTINDTEDHFLGITKMSMKYPNLRGVELMPYHEYGADKYNQIGREPFHLSCGTVSKTKIGEWHNKLIEMGCKNLILS
jgi:pyruvate formate lyase activating enzyme